jgi:hypothetical protein
MYVLDVAFVDVLFSKYFSTAFYKKNRAKSGYFFAIYMCVREGVTT